ncbi:potassium-transporting ATPase subunit KdpC [Acidothermaceae bacterium B102]|nr:potassium-transporting ATPase subunit KdpC [Acidothermaceae bacterium B102]
MSQMFLKDPLRQHLAALRTLLVLTVVLGLGYPLAATGIAQLVASGQANGSMVASHGKVVGSSLIGQNFSDAKGNPLAIYFQPRPSAAGKGYDPTSTSASNLGPNDTDLVKAINDRRAAIAAFDGVAPASVPADAVTASASGLDPDISPAYAYEQVNRVAAARHLSVAAVLALVKAHVQGRTLGFLGEPRVDVLTLNIALDKA